MANENEQAQQDSLKKMTEGQDEATRRLKKLADAFDDIQDPLKKQAKLVADANKGFLQLDRAIKSGRTRWVDATDDIVRLAEQIDKVTDASKKRELEEQLAVARDKAATAQRNKFLIDSFGELAKGLATAGVNITKSVVSSYQSGASAFQTFGDLQIAGMDAANNTFQNIAKGGAGAAVALGALGVVSGGTAIAIAGALTVISSLVSSAYDVAKFGIQTAVKELDATSKAFNDATKAGAIFTKGIMEFRDAGPSIGLTMVQLAKLISENGELFATLGGTVSKGVGEFKRLSAEMMPYRENLIKLGYSIEEISAGTLEYAAMVGSVSTKQRTDYANLAKESDAYLENLRLITAFTGEDVKKAKAAAEAASRDAAVDARLRKEEAEGNVNAKAKFEAMIQSLPTQALRDAYKQSYGMYGALTGENALLMSRSRTAYETMQQSIALVTDKNKTATQVTDEVLRLQKQGARATAEEIQSSQAQIGMAGYVNSEMRTLGVSMQELNNYYNRIAKGEDPEKIRKDLKTLKDAGGATADYARLIVEAQNLHIRIQKELDVVITQFQNFAVITSAVIKGIQDALGKAGYLRGGPNTGNATPQFQSTPSGAATGNPRMTQQAQNNRNNQAAGGGGTPPGTPGAGSNLVTDYGELTPFLRGNGIINGLPEAVAGGGATPEIIAAALKLTQQFPGSLVNALNDAHHQARYPGSKHTIGKAADLSIPGIADPSNPKVKELLEQIRQLVAPIKAEIHASDNGRGHHIHLEQLAKGTDDAFAVVGEQGPEIIQRNGASVTSAGNTSQIFNNLNDKLEQLIAIMKDQRDISEKTLYATS